MFDLKEQRRKIEEEKRRLEKLFAIKQGIEEIYLDVANDLDLLLNEYQKAMQEGNDE